MLERILKFSIDHSWLVVMLTLFAAAIGIWAIGRLPIDAVPDITNNQVQINAVAASLSPVEVVFGLDPGESIAVANTFVLKAELGKAEAEHQH